MLYWENVTCSNRSVLHEKLTLQRLGTGPVLSYSSICTQTISLITVYLMPVQGIPTPPNTAELFTLMQVGSRG